MKKLSMNDRSDLPKGWHWVKLSDVTRVVAGTTPKSGVAEYWIDGDIVWITPTDLGSSDEKSIFTSSRRITKAGFDSCGLSIVPSGSVVLSSRAPIGHLGIARVPLCTNQGCKSFVPSELVDTEFLYFALKQAVPVLQGLGSGATFKEVSKTQLENFEIPLPPLDEQRRIASRLNEQLAAVESARVAAEEQLEAARQLPSAYLHELFGDSAKHKWNWQKLGEVCELLPSKTIKSIGDTVVTAITTACLSENGFLPAGLKTSRMDAKDAEQALVKGGEILIARSNTPDLVGRVSIYPGNLPNVVASDLTIRIWAGSACHPPFLTAYLSYLYLSGFWKEMAGGASGSMKKITRTQVIEVKIPVPDIETQKKTVAELQSKMDNFRQLTQSIESQLAEINRLPASLLREAFAGNG
jgi:type I restriction enzyme, S subunit